MRKAKNGAAIERATKSLGVDAKNGRKFKVKDLVGGYIITAKTAKAADELTKAHRATMPKEAR